MNKADILIALHQMLTPEELNQVCIVRAAVQCFRSPMFNASIVILAADNLSVVQAVGKRRGILFEPGQPYAYISPTNSRNCGDDFVIRYMPEELKYREGLNPEDIEILIEGIRMESEKAHDNWVKDQFK